MDADLAGTWAVENHDNPTSVKSQTNCVISVAGCPVSCVSKLQSLIALLTLESECIALSTALQEIVPLKTILQELSTHFKLKPFKFITHSTIHEDNDGCP